ncbi:BrnA antitoxin family protein [Kaustia mangrovi]|uniref:BrnA antitoxin family protein n=1 Tax=Kaustia mangrovi TaxID=2593653 RepID=A0A7S8C7X3_9HYPH|nr:BrnA antitoxin family protein [Kaustia mangrovi]QPC45055.1 BrnA antitoxin family protein [Kaustia mangrovi]
MAGKYSSKRALTDKEEAEIQKMIASDPDNPEITDKQIAKGKSFAEALPELAKSARRKRGRPPVETPRKQISIRLDPDVIEKFKATGPGWQTRINEVLKKAKV